MSNKIKKLEAALVQMEKAAEIALNVFENHDADGDGDPIEPYEKAALDEYAAAIKKIKRELAKLKKEEKKKAAIPPAFSKGFIKVKESLNKLEEGFSKQVEQRRINKKKFFKVLDNVDRVILKIRETYSASSEEVFNKCDTLLNREQERANNLRVEIDSISSSIEIEKKKEKGLDTQMKTLLKNHDGKPENVYKHLDGVLKNVVDEFEKFMTANA